MQKKSIILTTLPVLKSILLFTILFSLSISLYQNVKTRSDYKRIKKVNSVKTLFRMSFLGGHWDAYCTFIRKNLFIEENYPDHLLTVPDQTMMDSELVEKDWPKVRHFTIIPYLFPMRYKKVESSALYLQKETYERLKRLPILKEKYCGAGKRVDRYFYLVKGLSPGKYKNWGMYFYVSNERLNIFTLPMEWEVSEGNN